MSHYNYQSNRRSWLKWLLIGLASLFALIVIASAVTVYTYKTNLRPVSSSAQSKLVVVKTGSSAGSIAKQLKKEKLIRSTWAFNLYVRLHNLRGSLQAGSYALKPNMSVQDIVSIVSRGKIDSKLITILPGQRLIDQTRESLTKAGFSEASVDVALDPDLYADHPVLADKPAGASLEGYIYPESFQKTADTTPQSIIRASLDEMDKRLTPQLKAAFAKQGLTPYQALIMASIVEKEVSNPEDKARVAQVFLKRLNSDIALGADPTASYGAVLAGAEPSIYYESAYNTHSHKGLPPTPISNVSESSLLAVANPANTDWLYFVAGDDGITYFSRTLSEHEALIEAHCKKLCSQTP